MNNDSYKIIISISHHRIAFEYWQRDGENKIVPMPNGNWPAPLAFYCSNNGIVIGEDALRAAQLGTSNAFDNYFDLLTGDCTYTIGGQTRPIRDLLLEASESIFRDFFKAVLFNRFGSVSDNRSTMPLSVVCESDVRPQERALISGLFSDSGYGHVNVVDYDRFIARYVKDTLSKQYDCDKVLVAWAEGEDLTFSLFDVNATEVVAQQTYPGLGVDPRKEYVKSLIWEFVAGCNPFLSIENEDSALSNAAEDFLNSSSPLINDKVLMSDGMMYPYSLTRINVENANRGDGVSIKDKLREFLNDNDIVDRERVVLLLRGVAAGNSYFERNLGYGFGHIIKSDQKLRENVMRQILDMPEPKPPVPDSKPPVGSTPPEPPKPNWTAKWRPIKAEANGKIKVGKEAEAKAMLAAFLAECRAGGAPEEIIADLKELMAKCEAPKMPVVDIDQVKKLERKWREVSASVKGKIRSGNMDEAKAILEEFTAEVSKVAGTDDLLKKIGDFHNQVHKTSAEPIPPKPTKEPAKPTAPPATADDGAALIAKGKVREARDWYRAHNQTGKAAILSDIIRNTRGVEARKGTLEQYRKSKDKVQIGRIIQELQAYIDLCDKVGLNCNQYKKLLNDYRKI